MDAWKSKGLMLRLLGTLYDPSRLRLATLQELQEMVCLSSVPMQLRDGQAAEQVARAWGSM
eukprot:328256-Alexandrium_andersonii.AAC.1